MSWNDSTIFLVVPLIQEYETGASFLFFFQDVCDCAYASGMRGACLGSSGAELISVRGCSSSHGVCGCRRTSLYCRQREVLLCGNEQLLCSSVCKCTSPYWLSSLDCRLDLNIFSLSLENKVVRSKRVWLYYLKESRNLILYFQHQMCSTGPVPIGTTASYRGLGRNARLWTDCFENLGLLWKVWLGCTATGALPDQRKSSRGSRLGYLSGKAKQAKPMCANPWGKILLYYICFILDTPSLSRGKNKLVYCV